MNRSRQSFFTPYDLPVLLILISVGLGLIPSYDLNLSWPTLFTFILGSLLFFTLSRFTVRKTVWKVTASCLFILTTALAVYFLLQFGHFESSEKIALIDKIGQSMSTLIPDFSLWKPLANSIATFLEGGLFLALGISLTAASKTHRVAGFCGFGLIFLGLIISASRGAWLAIGGAGLIWAALYWRPARYLLFLIAAGLFGLTIYVLLRGNITVLGQVPVLGNVLGPLFIRPDRLDVFRNSLALVRDMPFTGIGLGNVFAMVYARYGMLLTVPYLYYSHNLFLEVWLEMGLLGITAFLGLCATIFTSAWLYKKASHDQPGSDLLFESTWIGLTAILIHGLTDARPFQDLWCWLPFFTLLALNGAFTLIRSSEVSTSYLRFVPLAVSGFFLIICAIYFSPLKPNFLANQGAILQARAELQTSLSDDQKASDLRQAESLLEKAIWQNPANFTANYHLGLICYQSGDYPRAIKFLSIAWQTGLHSAGLQKALGLTYAFNGNLDQAEPILRDVYEIVPELNYWGWFYGENQQPQVGLNAYRLSLRLVSNQAEVIKSIAGLEAKISTQSTP